MKLRRPSAEIFVPDASPVEEAVRRTTHMGVVAHPDDLEILAWPAIRDCAGETRRFFFGVVATSGAGSPRAGAYASLSDAEMRAVRAREQKKAATVGEYGALALLDYASADVKGKARSEVVEDLQSLLEAARPQVLYTHNPADRHDTHVATGLAVIEACRRLSPEARPGRVLGGEVWRDLDWLTDADTVAEDASGKENLAAALIGVFDSQISGGKRYDLAVLGRRRAHATYHQSHHVDAAPALSLAMDLTPLVHEPTLEPGAWVLALIDRFAADVRDRIARLAGK